LCLTVEYGTCLRVTETLNDSVMLGAGLCCLWSWMGCPKDGMEESKVGWRGSELFIAALELDNKRMRSKMRYEAYVFHVS
jgi:hypothetical protein